MRSQLFHDFDAFVESIRDVDSKMLLHNASRQVWQSCLIQLGPIDVQFGWLGSGNIAQGQLRSDGHMIYLPLTQNVEYRANGTTIESGSCAVLEPGCEFCITTRVDHDWCAVFLPTSAIQFTDSQAMSSPTLRVTSPNQKAANKFRTTAQQILAAASDLPTYETSTAAIPAAKAMLSASTGIVGLPSAKETSLEGRPRISRREIISRCMRLIEERKNEHVNLHELLLATDVSERTLRSAFNEFFGIGPIRYIHLRQLHRVHRALKAADPQVSTVSQLLADHGEWAFSRFAARYQKHFGELPSQTLRGSSSP